MQRVMNKAIVTTVLGSVAWFLVPIQWLLLFTVSLVLCDLYTGWRASKSRFVSRGLRRSLDKAIAYFIAILIAHGFDLIYLSDSRLILSYGVSSFIAGTEMLSIYENIERITGVGLHGFFKNFKNGKP